MCESGVFVEKFYVKVICRSVCACVHMHGWDKFSRSSDSNAIGTLAYESRAEQTPSNQSYSQGWWIETNRKYRKWLAIIKKKWLLVRHTETQIKTPVHVWTMRIVACSSRGAPSASILLACAGMCRTWRTKQCTNFDHNFYVPVYNVCDNFIPISQLPSIKKSSIHIINERHKLDHRVARQCANGLKTKLPTAMMAGF